MPDRERKRKSISSATRWRVFRRDGFKCIYCGCQDELVIDHGDPFSRGGEDSEENYVTACRKCNSGKRDSVILPEDATAASGQQDEYRLQFLEDWFNALRLAFPGAVFFPPSRKTFLNYKGEGRKGFVDVDCDFFTTVLRGKVNGRDHVDISDGNISGRSSRFRCGELDDGQRLISTTRLTDVVIFCQRECDEYSHENRERLRNAVLMGMEKRPVMLLIGSPYYFFGAYINGTYKGIDSMPAGWRLDDRLRPDGGDAKHAELGGAWDLDHEYFIDPRDAFGLRRCYFPSRKILDEQHESRKRMKEKSEASA